MHQYGSSLSQHSGVDSPNSSSFSSQNLGKILQDQIRQNSQSRSSEKSASPIPQITPAPGPAVLSMAQVNPVIAAQLSSMQNNMR